jgi:hypothetical protein
LISVTRAQVNRFLVLLLSIVSLIAGAVISMTIGLEDSQWSMWGASFVRIGLLLIAFWIAMPTRGRAAAWADVSPYWVLGAILFLLLIARRPYIFIPFGIALFILAVVIPMLTGGRKSR